LAKCRDAKAIFVLFEQSLLDYYK
jgi:hypothetical protein